MIKNTLLFLLSLSLSFYLPLQRINLAKAQDFVPPEQNICNFTPGTDPQVVGDVTLANNCVIYEDVNGTSNGNIILDGINLTLYRTMVWYPGYEIRITNGATIYVNSNAQIIQNKLCLKDEDLDGLPAIKTLTINPTTGAVISPTPPPTSLTQLDMIVANPDGTCPQSYVLRETLSSIAYADLNDTSATDTLSLFSTDPELLRLGFEIDGVTDVLALAGDIIVGNNKNLIINSPGKLGIGTATPAANLVVAAVAPQFRLTDTSSNGSIVMQSDPGGSNTSKITVYDYVASAGKTLHLQTDNNNLIIGENGGNVGIGTTNPASKLQVSTTGGDNIITSTSVTSGGAYIITNGASNYYSAYISQTSAQDWRLGQYGADTNFVLADSTGTLTYPFKVEPDTPTNTLYLDSAGYVGIGTADPTYNLAVNGSAYALSLNLYTPGGSWLSGKTGTYGLNGSGQPAASYSPFIRQTTSSGHVVNLGGLGDDFGFFGYDAARAVNGYDYNMTMDLTNGNIGIGTITPASKLDVVGSVGATDGFSVDGQLIISADGSQLLPNTASVTTAFAHVNTSGGGIDALNSGDWDLLVYETQTYIPALMLGYNGTASISSYDTDEALSIFTNGTGTMNLGGGSGTIYVNSSDWDISTTGVMTGISGITNNAAITSTGGIVSLNASSNFATNINTGTSTGTVTIGNTLNAVTLAGILTLGNGLDTIAVSSSDWDISTTGVMTGISGITTNGAYTQSGTGVNLFTGQVNIGNSSNWIKLVGANLDLTLQSVNDLWLNGNNNVIAELDDNQATSANNSFFIVRNGSNTNVFTVDESGNGVLNGTCASAGADCAVDLAERHYSLLPAKPGFIMSVDNSPAANQVGTVRAASHPNDPTVIGVVSTNPAITIFGSQVSINPGGTPQIDPYEPAIALSGRVPVVVTSKGGTIYKGDPISSSSIQGTGMKSVKAGTIVGKALESTENWNSANCPNVSSIADITWPADGGTNPNKPCFTLPDGTLVGKIMTFVNVSWFDPDINQTSSRIDKLEKENQELKDRIKRIEEKLGIQ